MPGRIISSIALALFAAILVASPARAEMIDIPACRRDLAAANHLIEAIQARDKDVASDGGQDRTPALVDGRYRDVN